jgi:phosphoglycolate phosphatase
MSVLSVNHTSVDTVVFDFDGTLAKLNIDFNQMRRVIAELVSRYGVDHQDLKHMYVLEMINETAAILQNDSPRKSKTFKEEAYRIVEDIEVEAAGTGELFEGTKKLLTTLREHSVRSGIITRNCARAVRIIFPDISSFCTAVVCRDHVRRVKPHPEQLNLALSRLDASPGRSLMIGDHPLDIETGHNAGALSAGVLTGRFQKEDFLAAGADMVFQEATDIIHLLR